VWPSHGAQALSPSEKCGDVDGRHRTSADARHHFRCPWVSTGYSRPCRLCFVLSKINILLVSLNLLAIMSSKTKLCTCQKFCQAPPEGRAIPLRTWYHHATQRAEEAGMHLNEHEAQQKRRPRNANKVSTSNLCRHCKIRFPDHSKQRRRNENRESFEDSVSSLILFVFFIFLTIKVEEYLSRPSQSLC